MENITDYTIEYYERYLSSLESRFRACYVDDLNEVDYRISTLQSVLESLKTKRSVICRDRILQLSHEIESYLFLNSLGETKLACDYRKESGCDLLFNHHIFIECVCSTLGDVKQSGFDRFLKHDVILDYREKNSYIKTRFSSSLCEKVKFYYSHVGKSIATNMPYIIFLSPGVLSWEWIAEENCMAITDILFGRGNPCVIISKETGQIVKWSYSHIETFKKWNNTSLNSQLFCDRSFQCVSGILVATESAQPYTVDNSFLFINPYASTPVNPLLFGNMVYWIAENNGYYCAHRNGQIIN